MLRRVWLSIALVFALAVYAGAADGSTAPNVHVAAGGELMFERPADFGLAVHRDQVLVRSMIPPCDDGFDYCLYYLGDELAGTNFQSAGIRMERRKDLTTPEACLFTPPEGYTDFQPAVRREDGFAVSVFAPVQNAAAGHYSDGKLFRLFLGEATCFEVETRIAASRFEHYAEGTIREFTQEQRNALEDRLNDVVRAIRLVARPDVVLFEPSRSI